MLLGEEASYSESISQNQESLSSSPRKAYFLSVGIRGELWIDILSGINLAPPGCREPQYDFLIDIFEEKPSLTSGMQALINI